MQISRIRLSDKTSRLHPRHVVPKPAQAYEPEVPVKVREWISSFMLYELEVVKSGGGSLTAVDKIGRPFAQIGLTVGSATGKRALIIIPSQGQDTGSFQGVAQALNSKIYGGRAITVKSVIASGRKFFFVKEGKPYPIGSDKGFSTVIFISHGAVDGPNLAYGDNSVDDHQPLTLRRHGADGQCQSFLANARTRAGRLREDHLARLRGSWPRTKGRSGGGPSRIRNSGPLRRGGRKLFRAQHPSDRERHTDCPVSAVRPLSGLTCSGVYFKRQPGAPRLGELCPWPRPTWTTPMCHFRWYQAEKHKGWGAKKTNQASCIGSWSEAGNLDLKSNIQVL
jgi:hypothetical protein